MNDNDAIKIIRDVLEERMKLIHGAMRKRSLTHGQRRDLADNHRAVAQALDRSIGALQYRVLACEASKERKI